MKKKTNKTINTKKHKQIKQNVALPALINSSLTPQRCNELRIEYALKHQKQIKGKYPRQKLLPEYQSIYPWILPDEVDPYFAFCIVCESRMSAKRCDLRKHEESIKHKANAARKSVVGSGELSPIVVKVATEASTPTIAGDGQAKANAAAARQDDDMDDVEILPNPEPVITELSSDIDSFMATDDPHNEPYIKQEPLVQLVEQNGANVNLNQSTGGSDDDEDDEDGEDDEEDEDLTDAETDATKSDNSTQNPPAALVPLPNKAAPPQPQLVPNPLSQIVGNATTNSNVPAANLHSYLSATMGPNHLNTSANLSAALPLTPKLTIKKIMAPITTAAPTVASVGPLTSTATISLTQANPVLPSNLMRQYQQTSLNTAGSTGGAAPPSCSSNVSFQSPSGTPRDSFELFFDSVCATVKSFPPKLAAEAKIRVMTLIGELEIRALSEREQENSGLNGPTAPQYPTVASTTK